MPRYAVIKSNVNDEHISRTFSIGTSNSVGLAEVINFGKKYVALTSGEGTVAVMQTVSEEEGSINEDA